MKNIEVRTGKMIPLDPNSIDAAGNLQAHNCPQYRLEDTTTTMTTTALRYLKCKSCNYDIYFDEKQKSDSGKFIPISRLTNKPHQCSSKQPTQWNTKDWNKEREAEAVQMEITKQRKKE
jgi:hypothetical protein